MPTVSIELKVSTNKIRILLSGDTAQIETYLAAKYGNDSDIKAQIGNAPGYRCELYGIAWSKKTNHEKTKVEFWLPVQSCLGNAGIMNMIGNILRPLNLPAGETPGQTVSISNLGSREYVTVVPELTAAKDDALACVTEFIALSETLRREQGVSLQPGLDKVSACAAPTPAINKGIAMFGKIAAATPAGAACVVEVPVSCANISGSVLRPG